MGYAHYWEITDPIPQNIFDRIAANFKRLVPTLKHLDVKLGNASGEDKPVITSEEITFNGLADCGHVKKDLVIPWPTSNAAGVTQQECIQDTWFAGHMVNSRTCDGDCSYETFSLQRTKSHDSCKTAFRPYDLAVNTVLTMASLEAPECIRVSSDGNYEQWQDAIHILTHFLGYQPDAVAKTIRRIVGE